MSQPPPPAGSPPSAGQLQPAWLQILLEANDRVKVLETRSGGLVLHGASVEKSPPKQITGEEFETKHVLRDGKPIVIKTHPGGYFRDILPCYAGAEGSPEFDKEKKRFAKYECDYPAKMDVRMQLVFIDCVWMTDVASVIRYLTNTTPDHMARTMERWATKASGHIKLQVPLVHSFCFYLQYYFWYHGTVSTDRQALANGSNFYSIQNWYSMKIKLN